MKSFFSILSIETNSFSGEQIAIGLIFVTPEKIYFKYAPSKLKWLKKIKSGEDFFILAKEALESIHQITTRHNKNPYSFFTQYFSDEYFKYLNQYSAGALVFSEPRTLPLEINDAVFENYFQKIIGIAATIQDKSRANFHQKVKKLILSKEIEEFADIDYVLKPDQIEGILKDFKLSLLTKNGSVQAMETVDFTASRNSLISHLYEMEILYKSLNKFCNSIGLIMSKFKVAFEPPNKNNMDLFNLAYDEKKDLFEFNEYHQIEEYIDEIKNSGNYEKFSKVLEYQQ